MLLEEFALANNPVGAFGGVAIVVPQPSGLTRIAVTCVVPEQLKGLTGPVQVQLAVPDNELQLASINSEAEDCTVPPSSGKLPLQVK